MHFNNTANDDLRLNKVRNLSLFLLLLLLNNFPPTVSVPFLPHSDPRTLPAPYRPLPHTNQSSYHPFLHYLAIHTLPLPYPSTLIPPITPPMPSSSSTALPFITIPSLPHKMTPRQHFLPYSSLTPLSLIQRSFISQQPTNTQSPGSPSQVQALREPHNSSPQSRRSPEAQNQVFKDPTASYVRILCKSGAPPALVMRGAAFLLSLWPHTLRPHPSSSPRTSGPKPCYATLCYKGLRLRVPLWDFRL